MKNIGFSGQMCLTDGESIRLCLVASLLATVLYAGLMSENIAGLARLKSLASLTKDYSPRLDFYPDLADNTR